MNHVHNDGNDLVSVIVTKGTPLSLVEKVLYDWLKQTDLG